MITCNCGRKIPDGAICFCSNSGNSVVVYIDNNTSFPNIPEIQPENVFSSSSTLEYTRALWRALHTYEYINEEKTKEWFEEWLKRLPCGECKEDSRLILEKNPLNFSSKEKFFESGVKFHNMVNCKLNKKEISIEEALNIWNN